MSDTYYTPDLSEFYIGFEYEIKTPSMTDFVETVYSEDDFNEGAFKDGTEFRVRVLDEHTLLRIGFKKMTDEQKTHFGVWKHERCYLAKIREFPNGKYTAIIVNIHAPTNIDKTNIDVYLKKEGALRGYGSPFMIFTGTVKNKSELKKLFQMLNIY